MNRPRRSTTTKSYARFVCSDSEDEVADDEDVQMADILSIDVEAVSSLFFQF
jgi:hypothetical protein